MPKFCQECHKKVKEEYLIYCPKCESKLVFIYSRQDILDKYQAELEETSKSILKINEKIYNLNEKLQKANNHDAIIDLRFKITILEEKITPLENNANSLMKKISQEEKKKRKEDNAIRTKENIYKELYVELTNEKLKLLKNNKKFKNKSKQQIIKYFMQNHNNITEILNELNSIIDSQIDFELLYKELYVEVDNDILEELCDYFSIKFTSKDKILKELIDKYSRNAIFNAINDIKNEIELENIRKQFYDYLMKTFDDRDVAVFCQNLCIKNPSRHKIINHLVDNYSIDEIDSMKIEFYNKQQKEEFQKYLAEELDNYDLKLISDSLSINNQDRDYIIKYVCENFSKEEFELKLEEIRLKNKSDLIEEDVKNKPNIQFDSKSEGRLSDEEEREKMDIVLKCLSHGKTYDESAKKAKISPNLIEKWRKNGIDKFNDNTIYFYKELRKIELNPVETDHLSSVNSKSSKNSDNYSKKGINNFSNKDVNKYSKKEINDYMDKIINLMKEGNSLSEATKKTCLDMNEVKKWYDKGLKSYDDETRNFYIQVCEIEYQNRLKKTKPIVRNIPKMGQDNSGKNTSSKIKYSNVNIKPVRKIPPKNNDQDTNGSKDQNIRKDMDKVIDLMRKGNNRMQASKKSNINIGQIATWYKQGSKGNDVDTIYFYNEVKKIESS